MIYTHVIKRPAIAMMSPVDQLEMERVRCEGRTECTELKAMPPRLR